MPNAFELDELEQEDEFRLATLSGDVRAAFAMGPLAWPLAVKRAIASGLTNLVDLTDMVFFMHHPERLTAGVGAALRTSEPDFSRLSNEWKAWRTLVQPMLKATTPVTPATPAGGTRPSAPLRYGVPGGVIGSPFDDFRRRKAYSGYHRSIDVSTHKGNIKGADDPRRGLPVHFTPRLEITKSALDTARVAAQREGPITRGLGVPSSGNAVFEEAQVIRRGVYPEKDNAYGSHVGIACVYAYPKGDGTKGRFTFYIEYLHLITRDTLPVIRPDGTTVTMADWLAAGKGNRIGFGPRMTPKTTFSRDELASASPPPVVGYLGATVWPHVHIQVAFTHGVAKKYAKTPRVDPEVAIV